MHLSLLSPRVGASHPREIDWESLSLGGDFDIYALPQGPRAPGSGIWHGRHLGRPRESGNEWPTILLIPRSHQRWKDLCFSSKHQHNMSERKVRKSVLFFGLYEPTFLSSYDQMFTNRRAFVPSVSLSWITFCACFHIHECSSWCLIAFKS